MRKVTKSSRAERKHPVAEDGKSSQRMVNRSSLASSNALSRARSEASRPLGGTPKPVEGFRFIDLFAGIGGIRLAFEGAGGSCVFSSEWDKFSQLTYATNFGERPDGDITKISAEDVPEHDVLAAGFPCQPFSQAGLKQGFQDTRGTLFFDVARIVEKHRPAMLLLENVKGFVGHDKGRTMKVVIECLEQLGYSVYYKLLNARDFGLPQNRQRIFIVGMNNAKLGDSIFSFPKVSPSPTRLGQILENDVHDRYTLSDRLWQGHQRRLAQHREKGNGFGYRLFNGDSPYTSTISARYYKDGSEILIEQLGFNPRKLTPREAARLQGFPDTFMIPVSDGQAYKQFGNSVAVPVVKAIAHEMSQLLLHPSKRLPRNTSTQLALFS